MVDFQEQSGLYMQKQKTGLNPVSIKEAEMDIMDKYISGWSCLSFQCHSFQYDV